MLAGIIAERTKKDQDRHVHPPAGDEAARGGH